MVIVWLCVDKKENTNRRSGIPHNSNIVAILSASFSIHPVYHPARNFHTVCNRLLNDAYDVSRSNNNWRT